MFRHDWQYPQVEEMIPHGAGIRFGATIGPRLWVLLENGLDGSGTEWSWPVKIDKKPADAGLSELLAANNFNEIAGKDGRNKILRGEDETMSDLVDGQREGENGKKSSVLVVIG